MRLGRVARRVAAEILPRIGIARRRRIGGFEVAYTTGRGFGVFALRPYGAGELLMPVRGVPGAERGEFTIQIAAELHLEPEAPLRFSNHSCDPSAGILLDASGRAELRARRAIAPGDEITWDYATAEESFTVRGIPSSFRCRCGALRCRGVVDGWPSLPRERREEYGDWVMPHLRPLR